MDKKKTVYVIILLICNLSSEYSLISILYKHTDSSLSWQAIYRNLNLVSRGGVYVMRSITTCPQVLQLVCCSPDKSHDRRFTALIVLNNRIGKSPQILPT